MIRIRKLSRDARLSAGLAMALFVTGPAAGAPLDDPVRIDSGLVAGRPADGGGARVYRGVPYAEPPVGPLRWKPPRPPKSWEGVRACAEFGPACPQPKQIVFHHGAGRTDEDCLSLNLWTPARRQGDRLPVMVWIHGGGFTTGAGSLVTYDGAALAREGVVVVTINYRLGPFGFFAHPLLSKESARGVSGNYGLLDQIAALAWVKRNIGAFGGDPERVTIFGESAGSASVCRLMVSPLAAGLFHRAIAQSGGAHGRNRRLREAKDRMEPMEKLGERLAAALGCDRADDPLAALRAVSAERLLDAADPAQGLFGKGNKFGPVVDGWALPDDPAALFEAGKTHRVPFLIGSNADEGTIFLRQLPIKRVAGYRLAVRGFFPVDADAVLRLFPAETDAEVPAALNRLVTVASFVAPARALARAMEKAGGKAYLYHFTRVPPGARLLNLGAFHAAEIPYVFGALAGPMGYEEADRALSKAMRAAWARFADTGDPNGEELPEWPAYAKAIDSHMEFGEAMKIGEGLYREACDLIESIIKRQQARVGQD